MKSNEKAVTLEKNDGVALIRLNRPQTLNAVNREICSDLKQSINDAEQDDNVNAVVIAGNGRAFCAGGDLNTISELLNADAASIHSGLVEDFSTVSSIFSCGKPTIAAVHGSVAGGGCGIASACDFIYADPDSQFVFPFLDLGIIPDMGLMFLLANRVGVQAARRLLLKDQRIKADKASQIGLVDEICAPGTVLEESMNAARKLAKKYTPAMMFTKLHLNQLSQLSFEESLNREVLQQSMLWTTSDVREKVQAMLQKLATKT